MSTVGRLFSLLGLEAAWPSAQPKDNKGAAAAAHSCLLSLFPHTFILVFLPSEFLHRTNLTVLGDGWWAAASCAGPFPLWEQGCGYLCSPWCRIQEWDVSGRWPPAVSANVAQPRSGDMGHEGLVGILLWGPLESQVGDEWECGGSTQVLGGRQGACPWFFRSISDQWIVRLVGELWLSGSCRHRDNVMWFLNDCPLQMCWE